MVTLRPAAFVAILASLTLLGCGKNPPSPIKNAVVTIKGKPNEKVYVSLAVLTVTIEGSSTNIKGPNNYGVKSLDEEGKLTLAVNEMVNPDPLHGFILTVVGLNENPLEVSVEAEGQKSQSKKVEGKLEYADIKVGYQRKADPDSPFAHDPEDHLYEAREYLKSFEKSNKVEKKN